MLRRSHRLCGDFRSVPKLADEFSASISRQSSKYDHILIDVGTYANIGTRVMKGLNGVDRDLETSAFIQRQIFGIVLRKYSAAKSIGLFFDGSDPLWKTHRSRKFPGKKFEGRFYRSCASPLAYMCEERMRTAIADTARGKVLPEFTISGPATAGPVEAKMSAYLNDLAARFVDTTNGVAYPSVTGDHAASSAATFAAVQPTDSVLIVGQDDSLLTALGALPFSNITTVLMDVRDLKSLTMAEGMEWMTMQNLGKPATAQPGAALTLQQQKARVDALILYLLGNGCPATDLSTAGLNFNDLMAAYFDGQNAGGAATGGAGNYLCDLAAPAAVSSSTRTVGIDLVRLERLLAKASKRSPPSAREDPQAADYLEVLLQTVAMYCDGGIKDYGFVPRSPLLESPPQMKMDQLLGHIKFLCAGSANPALSNTVVSASAAGTANAKVIVPRRSEDRFALTAAEQLLVSAALPAGKSLSAVSSTGSDAIPTAAGIEGIKALHPYFVGGHEIPEKALVDVLSAADVKEAASAARDVLSYLDPNDPEVGHHPGLRHCPSYYFYQTKTVGPPAGYEYLPVVLGARSEEQQTRAEFIAKAVSV